MWGALPKSIRFPNLCAPLEEPNPTLSSVNTQTLFLVRFLLSLKYPFQSIERFSDFLGKEHKGGGGRAINKRFSTELR